MLNVAAHICYEHCSLFLYIFALAPGSFDLCNSFWNMKTRDAILFSEICLIYIWVLVPTIWHVLLFPGCLCGSSGSFQFSTLHHLGAIAKKLILTLSFLFLWLNFVVSDRDVGFYLKCWCTVRGAIFFRVFYMMLKNFGEKLWTCEPFIFCLQESWGPPSWSAFPRAKQSSK